MWFRATDVPRTKPAAYSYKPKREPAQFKPFPLSDSDRLERAFQKQENLLLVLRDGLYTVHFKDRLIRPTYWDGPAYDVRRGTWFKTSGSKLTPINEALASELEHNYLQGRLSFTTKSGSAVSIKKQSDGAVVATFEMSSWIGSIKVLGPIANTTLRVIRGYKAAKSVKASNADPAAAQNTASEQIQTAYVDRPVEHLLLCLHGMGHQLSLRYEHINFVKDVNNFRAELAKAYANNAALKRQVGDESNHKLQALPILWRLLMPEQSAHVHPQLAHLRPQDLFLKYNILAEIGLDYFMYSYSNYHEQLVKNTAAEMNRIVELYARHNAAFRAKPRVSIVGHSLGSVIAHDLLKREKYPLDFPIENLFLLGSPQAMLQLCNGEPYSLADLHVKKIYNIIQQSDPIATRLEPLVCDKGTVPSAPMPIPTSSSILDQVLRFGEELAKREPSITGSVRALWNAATGSPTDGSQVLQTKEASVDSRVLSRLKKYNPYGRLDFCLRDTVDWSLIIGLAGHFVYMESPDVASFILNECCRSYRQPGGSPLRSQPESHREVA